MAPSTRRAPTAARWQLRLLLVGCCALVQFGCEQQAQQTQTEAATETDGLTAVTEAGPVTATVSVAPAEPLIGDPVTLTLSVVAKPGVRVEMPAFGEALGRFSIIDFVPRESVDADGTSRASQRYRLQAPFSGRQRIPRLRVEFFDERDGPTREFDELLTDGLTISVQSVLPEGAVIDELRPPRGELQPLGVGRGVRWLLVMGALVAVAAGLFIFARLRSRATVREQASAYDRARGRLQTLASGGLPEGDAADGWYVELSDIMRRYIEERFQVRAPELTTEEFLTAARESVDLSQAHRELLSELLARCDRVKFARYSPPADESRDALDIGERFLAETRLTTEAGPAAGQAA
ncbi:MAG: hypothetical protein AAF515_10290 [Pseudomonadota bacterium]